MPKCRPNSRPWGAALGMLFGNVFDQHSSSQTKISCHGNPADSGQLSDMISELLESADARKAAYLLNVYKTTGKIRGFGALPYLSRRSRLPTGS